METLHVIITVWAICLWLIIGSIAALLLKAFIKATWYIWAIIIILWPLALVVYIVLDMASGIRAAIKK